MSADAGFQQLALRATEINRNPEAKKEREARVASAKLSGSSAPSIFDPLPGDPISSKRRRKGVSGNLLGGTRSPGKSGRDQNIDRIKTLLGS